MEHSGNHGCDGNATMYLSHKQHNFLKIFIEDKMCVSISSTNFVYNIYHSRKNSEKYCHECA